MLDGLEEAVIGLTTRDGEWILAYSVKKIIDILMERDGMEYGDAVEFYEFNIGCLYAGERTPVLIWDLECCEDEKIN